MMQRYILAFLIIFSITETQAQLIINNGTLIVESGASIEVRGNITSNADITGAGKVVINGTGLQEINMNGKVIPNLQIDNINNVSLTGEVVIGKSMLFSTGKIIVGNNNLLLSDSAASIGHGSDKFIETNGTGRVVKAIAADLTQFEIPVGVDSKYLPVYISAAGSYTNASVSVLAKDTAHPNKPVRSADFLNCYWSLSQAGITGTLRATGKYDIQFSGNESDLRGVVFSDGDWNLSNTNINTAMDTTGALISTSNADLYAMNRFVYLKNKVFLQGAYNTGTGLMNDNLRSLASFPASDPYRLAPYNGYFSHTNNTSVETIASPATVLAAQPLTADNIVDWVFIELRNASASPGNAIVQTRSALLQRDGDVVDMDGKSPVYFNNVDSGNYTIAIRHRNHLGLSTDPATFLSALNEKSSTPLVDMTTSSDIQLFGSANMNYAVVNGVNMLYAGNVSGNGVVRYQGTNGPGPVNVSDRVALLTDLGNNELNTLNTYQRGDVTMNGVTRYQGTNGPGANNVSDRIFILGTVLGNNEIQTKTQALPN